MTETVSDYTYFRSCIKSGDTIAIKSKSIFGKGIRLLTGDQYSHVGIAFWEGTRLLLAEMDGVKNVIVPLSQYDDVALAIYRAPIELPADIESVIWDTLGVEKHYSWVDILKVFVSYVLSGGATMPKTSNDTEICTEFNMEFYRKLGWVNTFNGYAVTPGLLCKQLGDPIIQFVPIQHK